MLKRNLPSMLLCGLVALLPACDDGPGSESDVRATSSHEGVSPGSEAVLGAVRDCDPTLACEAVATCVGIHLFPTVCGPDNCDEFIGFCEPAPECDPSLDCAPGQACVNGALYPTECGPDNCDTPSGPCDPCSGAQE